MPIQIRVEQKWLRAARQKLKEQYEKHEKLVRGGFFNFLLSKGKIKSKDGRSDGER